MEEVALRSADFHSVSRPLHRGGVRPFTAATAKLQCPPLTPRPVELSPSRRPYVQADASCVANYSQAKGDQRDDGSALAFGQGEMNQGQHAPSAGLSPKLPYESGAKRLAKI